MSNGSDDDKIKELKEVLEEVEQAVEATDDLADDVGFGFWDGFDVVVWIVSAIAGFIGIISCIETGGLGCALTAVAFILTLLDIIAKLIAAADTYEEKQKAEQLEDDVRNIERRLRDLVAGQ